MPTGAGARILGTSNVGTPYPGPLFGVKPEARQFQIDPVLPMFGPWRLQEWCWNVDYDRQEFQGWRTVRSYWSKAEALAAGVRLSLEGAQVTFPE